MALEEGQRREEEENKENKEEKEKRKEEETKKKVEDLLYLFPCKVYERCRFFPSSTSSSSFPTFSQRKHLNRAYNIRDGEKPSCLFTFY